jgi:hypothetical protein
MHVPAIKPSSATANSTESSHDAEEDKIFIEHFSAIFTRNKKRRCELWGEGKFHVCRKEEMQKKTSINKTTEQN